MSTRQQRTSWLTEFWTTLAAASGVGYLATAYTVSRWLTRKSPGRATLPLPEPGLTWDELECTTEDGLRLTGWVAAPQKPRATVAIFHGLRGNRGKILDRVEFLTRAGYRCVAFDHRAHGRSQGRRTSFGYYESRDVVAILDLIRRRWPDQPRAALGISMGAAALCYAGKATSWDALVLESLYLDLAAAFKTRVGSDYPTWFKRFRRGVIWVTERRLRVRLTELCPARHIGHLAPAPVLLLTGSEDPHAPPEDVQQLFDHCHEPRELSFIPGAGHADVCEVGGLDYQSLIVDFFGRRLK